MSDSEVSYFIVGGVLVGCPKGGWEYKLRVKQGCRQVDAPGPKVEDKPEVEATSEVEAEAEVEDAPKVEDKPKPKTNRSKAKTKQEGTA